MMHVIIRDGHVDTEYVQRHTSGFDALREHVATWTPARAAAICGLGPSEIERLATAFATTRPAAIRTLIGPEHREHGAMAFRTISCLPLLTGAWRDRGGGYARATGSWFSDVIDETGLYGASLGDTGVANSLTNDALTDRGGGAAFHDTLVEVTAISRERPARPTTPAG